MICIVRWINGGLFCSQIRPEYAFVIATETEKGKCTDDLESDVQNAALKSGVLIEVTAA